MHMNPWHLKQRFVVFCFECSGDNTLSSCPEGMGGRKWGAMSWIIALFTHLQENMNFILFPYSHLLTQVAESGSCAKSLLSSGE